MIFSFTKNEKKVNVRLILGLSKKYKIKTKYKIDIRSKVKASTYFINIYVSNKHIKLSAKDRFNFLYE